LISPCIMTTDTTGDPPHSQWRNCQCPLNGKQDGICGCPYFWERKASDDPAGPETSIALKHTLTPLKHPSTAPSGPLLEICFFWYHGTCRRRDQCKLAHESHITWPITPPPGFVHYDPCNLPLCPLRQDIVAFKEDQIRHNPLEQLGGQLDGAASSSLGRSSRVKGISGDDESTTMNIQDCNTADGQTHTSLIDPSSRALIGPYSDSSGFGSDDGSEAATVKVSADPQQHNSTEHTTLTLPRATANMEYLDLSTITPPPPSPDCDESPLLSLSHPGTLGKRKRTTSPKEQEGPSNQRQKTHPEDFQTTTYPIFTHGTDMSRTSPTIPKGPRALGGPTLICFYWYHKGHCHPKRRRNGFPTKCTYAHTLDMPVAEVSLPLSIGGHPDCLLPLCPLRSTGGVQDTPKECTKGLKKNIVQDEPATPPRPNSTMNGSSSSPRDSIADVRYLVKGPKHLQLPKLTGAKRTRFKAQQRAVGNWQTKNGVMNTKTDSQIHEEKQMRKQNKREKRMKRLRKDSHIPGLDYDDAVPTIESVVEEISVLPERSKISNRSLTAAHFLANRTEQHNKNQAMDQVTPRKIINKSRVLVDYELPMGEERLDWDTDRIRRLFGEIE
jgi:hypothetical protein